MSVLRREEKPPGWYTKRDAVRRCTVLAGSQYSGAKGRAADLLLAETIPISNGAYRAGSRTIGARTGLSASQVDSLRQSILSNAQHIMEEGQPRAPRTQKPPGQALMGFRQTLDAGGDRAGRALLAVVARFDGSRAMPAILVLAARIMPADRAVRAKRTDIARWAGVSTWAVERVERAIIRRGRAALEAVA